MSTVDKDFAYITPARTNVPIRFDLTATDRDSAHAEAQRIGEKFGSYTYIVRQT